MKYSSRKDTLKHIRLVRKNILKIVVFLLKRAFWHDWTKLKPECKKYFDIYTPKLAGCTYGSEEYKKYLEELKPALDFHYKNEHHHPEHWKASGHCGFIDSPVTIRWMNLVDILEMFCDWYAATKRHNDGDIMKSIAINQKRFGYSDDLKAVFENTYRHVFQEEG
jgi:hypothetical protein